MFWSAAGEKTLSNWYVLLLSALGPMDSSTVEPLIPLVVTTTPLFSRTSRSLRPRHRTTTLMLVSSPSASNSRSLRFSGDDRGPLEDATDSARDVRPPSRAGVAERPRERRFGRDIGGRIVDTVRLTCGGCPGRGRPDMLAAVLVCLGKKTVGLLAMWCSNDAALQKVNTSQAWQTHACREAATPTSVSITPPNSMASHASALHHILRLSYSLPPEISSRAATYLACHCSGSVALAAPHRVLPCAMPHHPSFLISYLGAIRCALTPTFMSA
jgi:hypothetical protein